MAKLPDIQVLIPYKTLMELLQASEDVKELRKENKRLSDQQTALRKQFGEVLEAFRDLKEYVCD